MTLREIVEKYAWALYDPDSSITDAHMAIEAACEETLELAIATVADCLGWPSDDELRALVTEELRALLGGAKETP